MTEIEYWLDLIEYYKDAIPIERFILLMIRDYPMEIPSVRFWALTFILHNAGVRIIIANEVPTAQELWDEMEDCVHGDPTGKWREKKEKKD